MPIPEDWKLLSKESDNYKLLRNESRLVEPCEESFQNIRSFKKWTTLYKKAPSSGSDTKPSTDSGRDTKEATSSSSYDATIDLEWIKLGY